KFFRDSAYALQGTSQQGTQVAHRSGPVQAEAFEGRLVGAWQNPTLVRHTRRIGTHGDEVAAKLNHAQVLLYFLGNNVTENTSFLALEIFTRGAEFVQDAAGHECSCGHL